MLTLDEARGHVLDRVAPLRPRELGLALSLGCVAADDVVAGADLPPFVGSAMDGYAVRAADVVGACSSSPVRLMVVGTRHAGAVGPERVGVGEAVRIMTGAALPEGADAVVMVEHTSLEPTDLSLPADSPDLPDVVQVLEPVDVGTAVRPAGSDVSAGDLLVAAGTPLTPAHLGVLASVGLAAVLVHPRPRVGVLSTGDELVPPGVPLGPGQIHDSDRVLLVGLLQRAGLEAVDLGWVPDDPDRIEAALRGATQYCDAVLTSGGVSMGDADLVRVVLDRIGSMRWMQVAVKPAKPFAFGEVDGVGVFGLPGNPVSSLVSFHLLALPGLRRLAGHPRPVPPTVPGIAGVALERRPDGKTHFLRVTTAWRDGRLVVAPVAAQGSHQLAASSSADALAVVPDGDGLAAGAEVALIPL